VNRNDVLTERYEELRQGAFGRHPGGTKGMALWARSWQEYIGGGVSHRPLKETASSTSPLSSTGDEVVRVLAGMVWALRKEAGS
jgi:hypothetical protein